MSQAKKGVLAVIFACMIWGFAPAYYKALSRVAAPEMLSHRTLWTLVFFGGLLAVQGRLGELGRLLAGPQRWAVLGATLLFLLPAWRWRPPVPPPAAPARASRARAQASRARRP